MAHNIDIFLNIIVKAAEYNSPFMKIYLGSQEQEYQ